MIKNLHIRSKCTPITNFNFRHTCKNTVMIKKRMCYSDYPPPMNIYKHLIEKIFYH